MLAILQLMTHNNKCLLHFGNISAKYHNNGQAPGSRRRENAISQGSNPISAALNGPRKTSCVLAGLLLLTFSDTEFHNLPIHGYRLGVENNLFFHIGIHKLAELSNAYRTFYLFSPKLAQKLPLMRRIASFIYRCDVQLGNQVFTAMSFRLVLVHQRSLSQGS